MKTQHLTKNPNHNFAARALIAIGVAMTVALGGCGTPAAHAIRVAKTAVLRPTTDGTRHIADIRPVVAVTPAPMTTPKKMYVAHKAKSHHQAAASAPASAPATPMAPTAQSKPAASTPAPAPTSTPRPTPVGPVSSGPLPSLSFRFGTTPNSAPITLAGSNVTHTWTYTNASTETLPSLTVSWGNYALCVTESFQTQAFPGNTMITDSGSDEHCGANITWSAPPTTASGQDAVTITISVSWA